MGFCRNVLLQCSATTARRDVALAHEPGPPVSAVPPTPRGSSLHTNAADTKPHESCSPSNIRTRALGHTAALVADSKSQTGHGSVRQSRPRPCSADIVEAQLVGRRQQPGGVGRQQRGQPALLTTPALQSQANKTEQQHSNASSMAQPWRDKKKYRPACKPAQQHDRGPGPWLGTVHLCKMGDWHHAHALDHQSHIQGRTTHNTVSPAGQRHTTCCRTVGPCCPSRSERGDTGAWCRHHA